jgi:hypothetical protein
MKTLLQIVQQFCAAKGLPAPLTAAGSTDSQIIQILALINEGLDTLSVLNWAQKQTEATFTSTAVENQGKMAVIAPGFKSLIPNTFWSLSNRLPAQGSISGQDTQILKVWGTPSAMIQFRQIGDELHFVPAGTAGLQYRFEYNSNYIVANSGGTRKQYFTADDDVPVIPDYILLADLRWRWNSEKELQYAELFRTCENLTKQAVVDSASVQAISMTTPAKRAMPGIVVPVGSWNA